MSIEKTGADIRRKVIQRFLLQLTQQHPQLYYEPASQIAHAIHKQIQNRLNSLSLEEQLQVKTLNVHDIEVILSFKD